MLVRCSRTSSLSRIPNLSRSIGTSYIPAQATHNITPIEIRPKPPAHFFTGKPNFFVAIEKLETLANQIHDRLVLARCPTHTGDQSDRVEMWKDASDLEAMFVVPKIRPIEYQNLKTLLRRLDTLKLAADAATDSASVDQIDLVLAPFIGLTRGQRRLDTESAQKIDAGGRSHTTGTRKTSKAHVWMQFTPALAETFFNPKEARRQERREIALARKKVAEEEREAEIRAAGAASLGPVFEFLDAREARLLAIRKADGLLPQPAMPPPKSPIEKVWDLEKEKKERFEQVAREMLALAEKDELELEAARLATETDAERELPTPITTTTLLSSSSPSSLEEDTTALADGDSSSPSSLEEDTTPLADGEVFVPPAAEKLWKEKVASELANFDAIKASRSSTPTASNSNSPDRSLPKDGTINVVNTTVATPPSDPIIGQILINNVPFHRYFTNPKDRETIIRPLKVARLLGAFNIFTLARTGGTTGMAGAISLGIARGICVHQPMARESLKAAGLLKVDTRMVERKKTGQPKARKKEKWVKR